MCNQSNNRLFCRDSRLEHAMALYYNPRQMGESGMQQHLSQRIVAGVGMQRRLSILQATGMELEHMVRQIVETNPVLDMQMVDDTLSIDHIDRLDRADIMDDDADSDREWGDDSLAGEESDLPRPSDYYYESLVAPETLSSHLRGQIAHSSLPEEVEKAAYIMVDSLDDRGFFEEDPEFIMERYGIATDAGKLALESIRDMDPVGIGARDMRESLLIQMPREGETDSLAFKLVESCWEELSKHRYEDAALRLGVDLSDVRTALDTIRRLNPDPGAAFRSEANPYIAADIVVERNDVGEWDIRLTGDGVPVLSMNDDYKEILAESSGDASLRDYLKKAFADARELMNDLASRQETLLKLSWILVLRQKEYFERGTKGLKPLGMESVAEEMGVSVSTVSRAVSGKYLLSPWGYKELRSFFSSGVDVEGAPPESLIKGDSLAQEAVQALILDLIREEDSSAPLSDAAIADKLAREHGVKIARRTVAKYRDLMKILPASLRKS